MTGSGASLRSRLARLEASEFGRQVVAFRARLAAMTDAELDARLEELERAFVETDCDD